MFGIGKNTERDIALCRMSIASFTPERPMIVFPKMYDAMKECGHFDDLMDRVQRDELLK